MASLESVQALFETSFGYDECRVWKAPGRVNLIGEHTDYNGGFVLPCAIDKFTFVAIAPNGLRAIRVVSERFPNDLISVDVGNVNDAARQSNWSQYVLAVFATFMHHGHKIEQGFDIAITSDVPDGAGLSSSAALEVALAAALNDHFALNLSRETLALYGQFAENHFVDCQCGIMDQMVVACAERDAAMLLDCRSLESFAVNLPRDVSIFIVHSGVRRGLVESAYNERRAQCTAAAEMLDVEFLCDAKEATLNAHREMMPDLIFRRARHVITENQRCRNFVQAMQSGSHAELWNYLRASHESLRSDYEVSVWQVDLLVTLLNQALGSCGAARMTGGGFGGCVVALAPSDFEHQIKTQILPAYIAETSLAPQMWQVHAASGVRAEA